jgi:hypothetical protein
MFVCIADCDQLKRNLLGASRLLPVATLSGMFSKETQTRLVFEKNVMNSSIVAFSTSMSFFIWEDSYTLRYPSAMDSRFQSTCCQRLLISQLIAVCVILERIA